MIEQQYRSKCCNAPVKTDGIPDFLGTKEVCTVSFTCTKCKKACDVIQKKLASSRRALEKQLLQRIKEKLPELEELLKKITELGEDSVYRFYHHSFKVYGVKWTTKHATDALRQLLPDRNLNADFEKIFAEGFRQKFTGRSYGYWHEETSPMLLALFHARYFLEMAIKYGKELKRPPQWMPFGLAALLHLYNIR